MKRNETRPVYVGNLQIGGQNKCILQSMTNVPAKKVEETIQQMVVLMQFVLTLETLVLENIQKKL